MLLLSQALAHTMPQPALATLALSVLGGSLFSVLSGFMAPAPTLPKWWLWFYYANPMSYNLYALTGARLGGRGEGGRDCRRWRESGGRWR